MAEAVYKVTFVETNVTDDSLKKENSTSMDVYRDGKSLYITSGNVVVNGMSLINP
jgi:hypothetical protein